MSGRGVWAVVKDSLITQMQSGHEATVKQSLTVHRVATTEDSSVVQIPERPQKQKRPCHG